jgi:hypothetical protein
LSVHRRVDEAGAHAVHPNTVLGIVQRDLLRQVEDPALGGAISRDAGRAVEAEGPAGVHDGAAAPLHHVRQHVFAAEIDAFEIGRYNGVPVRLLEVGEARGPVDAGVVIEDVDLAEMAEHPLDHGVHLVGLRHVDLGSEALAACGSDLIDGLLGAGEIPIGHGDSRTLAGKQERGYAPDSRARAGDNGGFVLKPHGNDPP